MLCLCNTRGSILCVQPRTYTPEMVHEKEKHQTRTCTGAHFGECVCMAGWLAGGGLVDRYIPLNLGDALCISAVITSPLCNARAHSSDECRSPKRGPIYRQRRMYEEAQQPAPAKVLERCTFVRVCATSNISSLARMCLRHIKAVATIAPISLNYVFAPF